MNKMNTLWEFGYDSGEPLTPIIRDFNVEYKSIKQKVKRGKRQSMSIADLWGHKIPARVFEQAGYGKAARELNHAFKLEGLKKNNTLRKLKPMFMDYDVLKRTESSLEKPKNSRKITKSSRIPSLPNLKRKV